MDADWHWWRRKSRGAKAQFMPTKAVAELQRLLTRGDVEIAVGETREFNVPQESGEPIRIHSKLVEGNFPNYKQVIPAESEQRHSG